jgi:RNA polymerase sigma-70 factor (ECF subfamily)
MIHFDGAPVFVNSARLLKSVVRPQDPPESVEDARLAERARGGDVEAVGELIGRYQKKAYAIAFQMCSGDAEEARDLTQEAFLKAFRSLDRFRGEAAFYTWFYRILINTCLDARRRRRRREKVVSFFRSFRRDAGSEENSIEDRPDPNGAGDPWTAFARRQLESRVLEALKTLSQNQETAFRLKVFHDMRISEIAEVMGVAEGTVKSHIFRATQTLRGLLKDWENP